MKSKIRFVVAAAAVTVVAFAGVAHAASGARDRDQLKLKDGSCVTVAAKGVKGQRQGTGDCAGDRDQLKLKDGSCVTTVAARAGKGQRQGTGTGDCAGDQLHLRDGSCLLAV
jgi:hypothetical protein